MAKVKKLPSGAYHTQLYIGKDDAGKRKYKSITADSPKEVRRLAALFEIEKDKLAKPEGLTLGVAMYNYTKNRINIHSPTTARNYDSNERNYFKDIQNIPVTNITSDHIQNEINKLAKNLARFDILDVFACHLGDMLFNLLFGHFHAISFLPVSPLAQRFFRFPATPFGVSACTGGHRQAGGAQLCASKPYNFAGRLT